MYEACLKKAVLGLLSALLCLLSAPAQALIENNMKCTHSNSSGDLGNVAPNTQFGLIMQGSCTVTRRYPVGASLQYSQNKLVGNPPSVMAFYMGMQLSEVPVGTPGTICIPITCQTLAVGRVVSYSVAVIGMTAATTGQHWLAVQLTNTSIGGWQAYGDYMNALLISYTVTAPSCSLTSPGTVNLNFGTLRNDSLQNVSQNTTVSLNCATALQANVTLASNQQTMDAANGLSTTSLSGLNMAARWTDSNTAVSLNSARSINLRAGDNSLNLGFTPRLAAGASPAGSFQAQYTLTIDYR
ncbi:fimbrial protein [Pseudomonas coleopterorum]|jgi:type 1 fimbria pilin|uniref:fimbrial protein n=1 Tax=Pseudomonas coleopterorum TaxID=1605838 RepID=UPI0006769970|nr:fimbrial protein [Pseudomonas coleopterorum]KNC18224.1 hypothetical protein AC788_00070 [Pseudomonas sp. RIT-PI-a]SED82977.1 Pilin (type 1 fimbria component protein) [Pseudomonas coleopterorum]